LVGKLQRPVKRWLARGTGKTHRARRLEQLNGPRVARSAHRKDDFMANPDTEQDAERAALIAASTVRQQQRRRTDLITPLVMALLVVASVAIVYMVDRQPPPARTGPTPPAAGAAPSN
jgi:hypothetical protein